MSEELKTTAEICARAEQDAADALRIAENYRRSTNPEIVAGQPSMEAHVVRLAAIAHDLRLLHANHASWVAAVAKLERLEKLLKPLLEWRAARVAMEDYPEDVGWKELEQTKANALRDALASALDAEGEKAVGPHEAHCHQGEYPDGCKYGEDDCPASPTPQTDLPELPPKWPAGSTTAIEHDWEDGLNSFYRHTDTAGQRAMREANVLRRHIHKVLYPAITAALAREKEQRDTLRAKLDEAEKLLGGVHEMLCRDMFNGKDAAGFAARKRNEIRTFLTNLKSAPEPAKPKSLCKGTGMIQVTVDGLGGSSLTGTSDCPGPVGKCEDPCHAKPERAECDGSGWKPGTPMSAPSIYLRYGCNPHLNPPGCRKCRPCEECGGKGFYWDSRPQSPTPEIPCHHCRNEYGRPTGIKIDAQAPGRIG